MRYWGYPPSIPRYLNRSGIVKRTYLIRLSILTIIILFAVLIWPHTWLLARDDFNGKHLGMWKLNYEEPFSIIYTHSVELTPVIETYHINTSDDLILDETIFHSYGAGLPSTTTYDFEMKEDQFRIYNINKKMDDLVYRTGAVRANHRLLIKNKDIPFLTFSEPREAVEFSAIRTSLLNYVIKEVIQ